MIRALARARGVLSRATAARAVATAPSTAARAAAVARAAVAVRGLATDAGAAKPAKPAAVPADAARIKLRAAKAAAVALEMQLEGMQNRPEVFDEAVEGLRKLYLHRPKAMNALTLPMIRRLTAYLLAYEKNPLHFATVLLSSTSPKAFCAGGDVKTLCEYVQRVNNNLPVTETEDISDAFFREEYRLNYLTSILHKPYIPIMDGVTMGGGVGISVHSPYTVATENTLFAMPETAIGFFPDVGGSFILPRLPLAGMGLFLGLTGYRLKGADVLHAGIASHYMPSANIPHFATRLTDSFGGREIVETALETHCVEPNEDGLAFGLEPHLDTIAHCFALETSESVEHVMEKLQAVASDAALPAVRRDFAQNLYDAMAKTLCPSALKVTFEQLRRGQYMTFADCLKMEFRISQHMMRRPDFTTGVSAKLIAKSTAPVTWAHPNVKAVSDKEVAAYFAPVATGQYELELPTEYDVHETPAHRTGYMQWNTTKYEPVGDANPTHWPKQAAKNA